MNSNKATYPHKEKLKSRTTIEAIFAHKNSVAAYPIRFFYSYTDTNQPLQIGFTVKKKSFKHAVDRNRIKRLMRECYRKNKTNLLNTLEEKQKNIAIMALFAGSELPTYDLIEEKFVVTLERLIKKINEESNS